MFKGKVMVSTLTPCLIAE